MNRAFQVGPRCVFRAKVYETGGYVLIQRPRRWAWKFGVHFFSESKRFGGQREREYGVAFHSRFSRKGATGNPHALTLKVFSS